MLRVVRILAVLLILTGLVVFPWHSAPGHSVYAQDHGDGGEPPPDDGGGEPPPDGGGGEPPPDGGEFFDPSAGGEFVGCMDPSCGGGETFDLSAGAFFDPEKGEFVPFDTVQFFDPASGEFFDFQPGEFPEGEFTVEFRDDAAWEAFGVASEFMPGDFQEFGGDFSFDLAGDLDQRGFHDLGGDAVFDMY